MAVMDASVYVALTNTNEPGHQASWEWFRKATSSREKIYAPVIILAEVAAAISRGAGDNELAHQTMEQLRTSKIILLIPVNAALAVQAATIAADHRIRGCDAVYVALAEQNGEVLISLDRQQLERGENVVTVREP